MSTVQVTVMRSWEYLISHFVSVKFHTVSCSKPHTVVCRVKARSLILIAVLNSFGTKFPTLHQSMRRRSCKKDWHGWLLVLLCLKLEGQVRCVTRRNAVGQ
jgi:hypothetical protein